MDVVTDRSGQRFVVEKRSSDAWLVRSIDGGETTYRDPGELTVLENVAPLEGVAGSVPGPVRRLLTAVHDERVLGLVLTTVDRDGVAVRTLLAETTLCESDLHGALGELVAAGLLEETTVAGERGYAPTELARSAAASLREE